MAGKRSSSGKKSAEKREGKSKYNYVELSKASLTKQDISNFYAVVVDATFPYKTLKDPENQRYVCSIKITDPSMKSGQFAQLVLYAKRFEDLPIISRIGDIIRVHRSMLRLHNGQRQFNANLFFNSSWALFSTDKKSPDGSDEAGEFSPFAYSGKHYTFEKSERSILGNLRKWAQTHFASNNVISNDMYVPLAKVASQKSDFDVTAKVLSVFERDEYTNEIIFRDTSNTSFHCLVLKLKFPNIRADDVVRIRSAIYDETSSKKVLTLSHYSNIMNFISHSKLAKDVRSKVHEDKAADAATLKQNVMMTPVVMSEIDKKHANLPHTSLADLFHNEDQSQTTFRTSFYITKAEPHDVKEYTKVYDKKTKKTSSLKGSSATKAKDNIIYMVQFLCKDVSTQFNNAHYKILLYTHEGLGANFFGVAADNLYKNNDARKKVEEATKNLTRFNAWVDAVVERRNGFYFIKDTKLIH